MLRNTVTRNKDIILGCATHDVSIVMVVFHLRRQHSRGLARMCSFQ
jgi:hypothetical protein